MKKNIDFGEIGGGSGFAPAQMDAEMESLLSGVLEEEPHKEAALAATGSEGMPPAAERAPSRNLGIALAPYHLESLGVDAAGHAALIRALGNRIAMFYAWQHGMGCHKKLPKEQELLQMPGRGKLDFTPIVGALKAIRYFGVTSIFMHPVPRGIPILKTAAACTTEINRARTYLEKCLANA